MDLVADIVIEDERWESLDLQALADQAANACFAHFGLSDASCVVMACDDARISALNAGFRGKARPTNVLSWPSDERGSGVIGQAPALPVSRKGEPLELGDIAISYDTCLREADEAGKPMAAHVTHLLVHSILHLLGFDHEHDADSALMEGLEAHILAQLGHLDPYST